MYPVISNTRNIQDLNGIWQLSFDSKRQGLKKKYANKRPTETQEIAVPGSINEQVTDREQYLNMDWVWYFRGFHVNPQFTGQRLVLRFGSVTYRAEVFLNGQRLGMHEGGFMPFEFDITDIARFGEENELAVRVDNVLDTTTVPQGNVDSGVGGVASWRPGNLPNVHYDFFPFTGIHRPVQLLAVPETRLENIRLTTHSLKNGKARLEIAVRTTTHEASSVEVAISELGLSKVIKLEDGVGSATVSVADVESWDVLAPKLYDVVCTTYSDNIPVDTYELPFGFRTIKVKGAKLLIKDKPVYLKGFGRHEDNDIIGKGQSCPHLVKEYNLMKWVGANSFRTSHYPYSEEDMRMADRQGFLVIDEAAANTLSFCALRGKDTETATLLANHKAHLLELFERDHNYACNICWSVGNECETWEENAVPYFKSLTEYARSLDDSRPVTAVINSRARHERCAQFFDILMVNRYPAWYNNHGKPEVIKSELKKEFNDYWTTFKKPIMVTEFGADTIPGLHNEYNLMWTEEYQVSYIREVLEACTADSHVIGAHIWNFADFKVGQHTARIVLNWKGLFTRDRHPKMAAHMVRQWWTGIEPVALGK